MGDYSKLPSLTPPQARDLLGDGNFGGDYQKPDADMDALWRVAVEETRELLLGPWKGGVSSAENR